MAEAEAALQLPRGSTLDEFNAFIQSGGVGLNRSAIRDDPDKVQELAEDFYYLNEDPSTSPNLRVDDVDQYSFLMDCLDDARTKANPALSYALFRVLKVLSRKAHNRTALEDGDMKTVVHYMHKPKSSQVASEVSSVVLNLCYEKENVVRFIKCKGVPFLLDFVRDPDDDVAANAAGALQSLSYQEVGRDELRELGTLEVLIPSLKHTSVKVRTRSVGVIHNMSSDVHSIAILREGGAIGTLVAMLSAPQVHICGSAAGAIQNLSREQQSKREILESNGVPPLNDLLFGADVPTQVCAAGALINLIGPGLESDPATGVQLPMHKEQRKGFSRLIMLSLVTGMAFHGMFSDDDD
uniref:Protein HGH1 homolog n=1 Tax=Hemiselmis tepida TaxID=464990 RepID=A0A7S0VCG2_9CRYP|mmetsp:Transcript_14703/g.37424  ORF Transcript_14703/g.37424 Transcript_14703/m.37424 type:complete len:353 (+) Transcript_14703:218-1276(+)